ncbi:MAG: GIY-YIG nuclease family protein [Candidatus Lokiarchaeota archaeon]|nr:GIY-YIG nuclease family protein [Candidatus Lokiarchaeota archaeon]MBD3200477.1 GIY-YIG nuclease family protein [Candidatus Lokiarchaeota archaeon]
MSVYYVYILETLSKKGKSRYYTGYTNNLYRRLNEHKKGWGAKFCRGKENISLKYFETHMKRGDAMSREAEIKSLTRLQKKQLIERFDKKNEN